MLLTTESEMRRRWATIIRYQKLFYKIHKKQHFLFTGICMRYLAEIQSRSIQKYFHKYLVLIKTLNPINKLLKDLKYLRLLYCNFNDMHENMATLK